MKQTSTSPARALPRLGEPPLTDEEKMTFARWVDLGAPISSPGQAFKGRGWFQDDLRPTLTISLPRPGNNNEPLTQIRIGAFDYYSGLEPRSFSVRASFSVNGKAAKDPSWRVSGRIRRPHLDVAPQAAVAPIDHGSITVR